MALSLAAIGQIVLTDDLTTLNGTTYHNYTVIKAENGFLTINFAEGTTSIKADILPEDIRQKYGFIVSPTKHPKNLDTLILKDGTIYSNVTVVKIEPDGLTILYQDGGVKITFEKLTDEICKLYNLTLDQALQYRASEKLKQDQKTAESNVSTTHSDNPSTASNGVSTPDYFSSSDTVYVHGYFRKNGTYVNGYTRRK